MARFNWKFLGYPARRIKDEIIRRMCVSFTASDGAVVNYRGKDKLKGKLSYRKGEKSGVNSPFNENEHLSSSIKEGAISNLVAVNDSNGTLETVEKFGCYNCSKLLSVHLPGVNTIGETSFKLCNSLTSIYAPNTLSILPNAFWECTSLSSIYFPNIKQIDRVAFYGCTSLTSLNISSVQILSGDQVFCGCKRIETLNLPCVTLIGKNVFVECKRLSSIYLSHQNEPPVANGAGIFGSNSNPTIWVKNETYKKYLTADYWKTEDISGHISSFTQPTVTFINSKSKLGESGSAKWGYADWGLEKDGEYYKNTDHTEEVQMSAWNFTESQCNFKVINFGSLMVDTVLPRYHSSEYPDCKCYYNGKEYGEAIFVGIELEDEILSQQKLNYGMSAEAPVISRPYYDFKGWDKPYVDVTEDVSCTAIFSKRLIDSTTTTLDMSSHIVTGTSADYEHTCDEINPGVSCMVDGVLTLLSNSIDYTLSYENNKVEWYDVNVGETRTQTAQVKVIGINYYSGMVSTDFTIGYTRNSSGRVTVTFDPCGGDYPAGPQQIEYSIGDTYGLCSEFSDLDTNARRGGHTFLGWFDVDGDTRVLSTDTIEKEQPYTLSAHWETNNFKLSITTSSDGWGSVNGHEMSSKSPLICTDIEYNTVVTLSAQPNFGYHFDHWGWGETLSVIDVLITSDTEKNVSFYPNEHILNLVVVPENGGTALGPSTCKYRAYTSISAYANDGYKFSQWKSDNDVDISKDYPHEISVSRVYSREDNDITVSAMFDILTYTITYDTDGGTETSNPTSYTVEDEITLLNDTTKENHEFLGWYEGDTKVEKITKGSTGNKSLKAKWEPHVILTYDTGYEDSKTITINTNIDKSTNIEYDTFDDLLD